MVVAGRVSRNSFENYGIRKGNNSTLSTTANLYLTIYQNWCNTLVCLRDIQIANALYAISQYTVDPVLLKMVNITAVKHVMVFLVIKLSRVQYAEHKFFRPKIKLLVVENVPINTERVCRTNISLGVHEKTML